MEQDRHEVAAAEAEAEEWVVPMLQVPAASACARVRTENNSHGRTTLQSAKMSQLRGNHDAGLNRTGKRKEDATCQEEMEQARQVLGR